MAAYKEVYDNLSKMLECGICMSQLNNPKVLHCNHSFCKDCLDDLLLFDVDGSATIVCPMRCEGTSSILKDQTTEQLGVMYQFKGIIDMYKDKQARPIPTEGNYFCHACEGEVVIYCSDCHNFYCKTCQSSHKDHSYIQITFSERHGEFLPVCKEHNALARFICCKKIICVYCQKRTHVGHKFETLKVHAERIKELFFNDDSSGKIERIMKNANDNYEGTMSDFANLKCSIVKTIRDRIFNYISKQISTVEVEALNILRDLDDVICNHLKSYPDITSCDLLETVTEKEDLELIVKKDFILKEYSRYTTPVPTLTVSLTNAEESQACPLGELVVQCGEFVSIGKDGNHTSVTSKVPDPAVVHNVSILVNRLENLMKEVDGKLSSSMPRPPSHYSEDKPIVKCVPVKESSQPVHETTLKQALVEVNKRGYEYLDELFSKGKEQLLIDIITKKKEVTKLRDNTGVTVLHSAAQYGFDKLILFLLKSKLIKVDVVQNYNQTPLHYAAYHNKASSIKVLLQYHCNTAVKNHKGNRPIDVATQYKSAEAILALQDAEDHYYEEVH